MIKIEKLKTRQEIAHEYGICVKTLNKIIEDSALDIEPRKLIKPCQQTNIRNVILGHSDKFPNSLKNS